VQKTSIQNLTAAPSFLYKSDDTVEILSTRQGISYSLRKSAFSILFSNHETESIRFLKKRLLLLQQRIENNIFLCQTFWNLANF